MIWRKCFKCGIEFKGKLCPNCSIKIDNFKTDLQKDIEKEGKEIQKNQSDYWGNNDVGVHI